MHVPKCFPVALIWASLPCRSIIESLGENWEHIYIYIGDLYSLTRLQETDTLLLPFAQKMAEHKIFYDEPANLWDECHPIGNGRL